MTKLLSLNYSLWLLVLLLLGACKPSSKSVLLKPSGDYKAQKVVLVVIDGVRYSDSWGDTSFVNIPFMARDLAPEGTFHPEFYNLGATLTNPGHVALTTGHYQKLNNHGEELPDFPSVFHYYRQHTGAPAHKAWIIASKDKLEILSKTYSSDSAAQFSPATNCGNNGLGTGYRKDSTTLRITKEILARHSPDLVLVNLAEPDSKAHQRNWTGYLKAIQQSDRMVHELWQWLQQHPDYQNNTTLLVTNDHGRHPGNRYHSHGDGCKGCRHISLLMLGPDVKDGFVASKPRSQVDVAVTIAELLDIPMPTRDGEPMLELLK
ncbi:alkaline phosphatase family protein [Rufibacter roseus]|uniref:Alkaline phosphatase family protein n=1 Tax=Rufibacter roseus TaxID=1567108 RepID=A0ABW2DPM4_9BACT|nr:alkaline phosphatase family protein [Rufibacter roseus]